MGLLGFSPSRCQPIIEDTQGRNSSRNLEVGTWNIVTPEGCCLLTRFQTHYFYTVPIPLPKDGTTHGGRGPPVSISNWVSFFRNDSRFMSCWELKLIITKVETKNSRIPEGHSEWPCLSFTRTRQQHIHVWEWLYLQMDSIQGLRSYCVLLS